MKKNKIIFFVIFIIVVIGFVSYGHKFFNCVAIQTEKQPVKMRKFLLNKLWRDKAIARLDKVVIHTKPLDDAAYEEQLNLKLLEEAQEVVAATGNKEDLMSEMGDVLEVLECIALFHKIDWKDILVKKQEKVDDRGSYLDRQYVTVAECQQDSWLLSYYLKNPERNIEIFD